jgi:hypothetical protein
MNNIDNKKQDWIHIKSFQSENALVKVNELQSRPRKRYSIEIGRANEDGHLVRHFGVFIDVENNQCKLRETISNRVAAVIEEAEEWILQKTQEQEDEIASKRKQGTDE